MKIKGSIPQITLKNLRKQWIPKSELNLHTKAIKALRKVKIVDLDKGPEFHSP